MLKQNRSLQNPLTRTRAHTRTHAHALREHTAPRRFSAPQTSGRRQPAAPRPPSRTHPQACSASACCLCKQPAGKWLQGARSPPGAPGPAAAPDSAASERGLRPPTLPPAVRQPHATAVPGADLCAEPSSKSPKCRALESQRHVTGAAETRLCLTCADPRCPGGQLSRRHRKSSSKSNMDSSRNDHRGEL